MFTLMGPWSEDLLKQMQVGPVVDGAYGAHSLLNFKGSPVIIAKGSGLHIPGYTLIADQSVAPDLWSLLTEKGAVPAGEEVWESARVLSGRPAPGSELSEDYNVLEAGLYSAASLNKGCYLGQETIAKVHNKDAVKQQLWGVELDAAVEPGTEITQNGERVGKVTSYAASGDLGTGHFALAYVRCRVKGKQVSVEGMPVEVGGVKGVVTPIPFATREFAPGAAPVQATKDAEESAETDEAAEKAEAERKAAKLAAMEAKLAAYMEAQKKAQESE